MYLIKGLFIIYSSISLEKCLLNEKCIVAPQLMVMLITLEAFNND